MKNSKKKSHKKTQINRKTNDNSSVILSLLVHLFKEDQTWVAEFTIQCSAY
jgi:hypothetical protein